jgi:parallel beta-helix repeat protein
MNVRTVYRTARALAVRLLIIAGLVYTAGGVGRAAGTVYINAGDDIQAQVNANSNGTTYVLRGGVHRMQSIRPKEGDTFVGEQGAVLSGARRLTNFSRTGGGSGSSTSYLSDRTWSYMTNGWGSAERDKSNGESGASDGRTLTLNGQAFTKGLGMHAPADVRYQISGCTTFSASVGMDDEIGANGDVSFQVWADGVRLWDSGMMNGNSATQSFNVNVSGRNELRLVVWEANNAFYDHADWADARLTCSGGGGSGLWVASGQTQQGLVNVTGVCQTGYGRCTSPEQLFIDNVQLQHVGSLGEVGPGKFFFDYNADNIYFADDPTGRTVETSVTPTAFQPTANYVTISGLIIERYAGAAQQGAVHGEGRTGWVVSGNDVRWNHAVGIRVGTGSQVRGNWVGNNGQLGVVGVGDNIVVENNEIYNNNTAKFWATWEAGGTKFQGTRNLVVRGNYVHNNGGPGLWTDHDNLNTLYENNTSDDNERMGIFVEISYDTIIRNNTVRRNGWGLSEYIWGAGILISASPNVQVYGNYLEGNADGIGAAQQNRGWGTYGAHEIWNLWVHDNTLVNNGGWSGIVQDDGNMAIFNGRNNWFSNNSYNHGSNAYPFVFMNSPLTQAQWNSYGQR